MKHYKTQAGEIYAFESDGSQDHLITDDMTLVSDQELAAMRAPSPASIWAGYQAAAQMALDKSDLVALRCFKADVEFPVAWKTYVTALRAIVVTESGDPAEGSPTQPSYPLGS